MRPRVAVTFAFYRPILRAAKIDTPTPLTAATLNTTMRASPGRV